MSNQEDLPTQEKSYRYMQMLWEQFIRRRNKARSISDQWASLLEACYYFAVPERNRFYKPKEQQGEQKSKRLYDTTSVDATNTFVSQLHDVMTPPQAQWGYLTLDENLEFENEDDKNNAQIALNDYTRRLFGYIHKSNFDVSINECYYDLSIGTSCIVVNSISDTVPLLYTSIPMDKLDIEESLLGTVDSWYRTWENIKIREIPVRWPKAQLTIDMLSMLDDNPDATWPKLYEGVMFMAGADKPYQYMIGTQEEPILSEAFVSNPGIVWRFKKVNNEVFGRGPVMDALPSMRSLNEMAMIELASANLNTFRPYMAFSDSVFNAHTFQLKPFTVIPISPLSSGDSPPIMPLADTSNPGLAQMTIADLRMQIKKLLFNDVRDTESIQPQTAYEVATEQQKLAQKIGPLFSRLQQEFLWPIIKRSAYLLDKRGILKMPLDMNGNQITFQYVSPLALAKSQQSVSRFTQWYQVVSGVLGPAPAMLYINQETMPYLLADKMDIDPELLNSPETVARAAQQLQDQQEAMMQQQMAEQEMTPQGGR